MSSWVTPTCPGCDSPPLGGDLAQLIYPAFCPNQACRVVSWNPEQTLAELAAEINYLDLSALSALMGPAPDSHGGRVPRERPPGE